MKSLFNQLDKAFENRTRLHIMSVLAARTHCDFNELKELLETTDGNVATHIKALEKDEYIISHKAIIGKKTNTTYTATPKGRAAFTKHLEAMENLIRQQKK